MDLGLGGKVALVSGGSAGMGRGIAHGLAAEGAHVLIAARREAPLRATAEEIVTNGGRAAFAVADMTKKAGVLTAIAAAEAAFGPVDIAVSNVRPINRFSFDDAADEEFGQIYEELVMSMVHLARALAPGMKARGFGRFVNIGSVCMKEPHRFYNLILSNTGRAASLGLAKSFANEFAPYGITVNTIAPGTIATGTIQQVDELANLRGVSRLEDTPRIPAGRHGTPEEIAAVCVFLCSARAGYVTGQTIAVDGGYTRGLL